jgi:hypothetical protein
MSKGRTRYRKWLMIMAVGLLAVILVALVAISSGSSRPQMQEVKLKDGRTVQLAAVTMGQTHTMHTPKLRGILFAMVPDGFKRQLGPNFNASFGFQHEGIALWLMCYDPVLKQYSPGAVDRLVIVDDHGCEMKSDGHGGTSDSLHHATVVNVSNFPRDRETLTFQIFDKFAGTNSLGEITIKNPARRSRAEWTPQKLPGTQTNGSVAVRLNGVSPHSGGYSDRLTGGNLNLEVFEDGKTSTEWTVTEAHYEDPLGNAGDDLCRQEKAWRLKTLFMREPTATFRSHEVWKVGKVTLPAAGKFQTLTTSNTVSDVPVKLLYLCGPGSFNFSNYVCVAATPWTNGMNNVFGVTSARRFGPFVPLTTRASHQVTLVAAHESLHPKREFMARFFERGRLVATAQGASGNGREYFYELSWLVPPEEIPPTNAVLDMEIIVQKGREFEFLVDPQEIQTAQPQR